MRTAPENQKLSYKKPLRLSVFVLTRVPVEADILLYEATISILMQNLFFEQSINRANRNTLSQLRFTSCHAEQPLRGMELQEKDIKKDKTYRKSV